MNDVVIETLDEAPSTVDFSEDMAHFAVGTAVDGKVYEVRDGDEVVGYVQKAPEAEEVI